jgi:hypothetical protein
VESKLENKASMKALDGVNGYMGGDRVRFGDRAAVSGEARHEPCFSILGHP